MKRRTLPQPIIFGFFILGVISASLFRSLVVVNRFFPDVGRILWYVAVFGYIFFFGYRYWIARKRRNLVIKSGLLKKVESSELSKTDREEVAYILQSLVHSREMYNYVFIFAMSVVAVVTDVIISFLLR